MEAQAVGLAEALGLLGRTVFVNDHWVPFEERASYLLEGDVGVSAHRDELEARFAYRTRLLDCIWTGLPIVTSAGEAVAEVVSDQGLGRVVECGDIDGYALALSEVLDRGRDAYAEAIAATRPLFEWPQVVDALERMLEPPTPFARRKPARVLPVTSYAIARARLAFSTRGIDGLVRRGVAGLSRSLRGDHAAHPDAVPGTGRNDRTPPAERLP
jgi:hypothetical protein